jgi:hypothetical protein
MSADDSSFAALEESFVCALSDVHGAPSSSAAAAGLRTAASLLASLRLEARGLPASSGAAARVAAHAAALAEARAAAAAKADSAASAALFAGAGGAASGGAAAADDGRARAAAATAALSGGSERLRAAAASLEATVATAEGSLAELAAQRETMGRIAERTARTSAAADEANTITKRMSSFWRNFGI